MHRNRIRAPRSLGVGTLALLALGGSGWSGCGRNSEDSYADMSNTLGTVDVLPVRGRIVKEAVPVEPAATKPLDEVSQEEFDHARVTIALVSASGRRTEVGEAKADEEGYLDACLDLNSFSLSPGRYQVEVTFDGRATGSSTARLLARDHSALLIRSDIDLTYLLTDFHSRQALADLLGQDATERTALPAMETVYRALRGGATNDEDRPLVFLSGSPTFFKRTLEGKAALDRIEQDGLVLKPFAAIVAGNVEDHALRNVVPELKEQIGYKLYWLLRLRTEVPPTASEVLLGDDSEADFVVYSLYHRFVGQDLDVAGLLDELEGVGVAPAWRDRIAEVAPEVETLGATGRVQAIYINQTEKPSERYSVSDWAVAGLSRHHRGAWPLILDLFEEGWVTEEHVGAVADRLMELGQTAADLHVAASDGVAAGFLSQDTALRFH